MRSLLSLALAGVAALWATSAMAAPFTGTISYGLSTLPPLAVSGSSSGISTVSPNLVTLPSVPFAAAGPVLITLNPTAASPLSALNFRLTAPANCIFTGTPLAGSCPLGGTANALVGYAPFLVVPNSPLGQNTRLAFGPYGSFIDAQAWIAGPAMATIGGSPILSTYGAPFTTMGYDNRTAGGAGAVKLVAPGGLMSTLGGNLPIFVHMTINFRTNGTSCVPVTTLEVGSPGIPPGGLGDVTVTTTDALTVGSTDVAVEFDPSVLQAVSASSSTLSAFTFSIDNAAGVVATASASAAGDALGGGDPLFTVTFTPAPGVAPGTTTEVTLSDVDGNYCDDLAGPVPPIPPVSLPYDQVAGEPFIGTLGDVDCDGSLTAIDASVVLGLFVGSITDGDLPPACSNPVNRLAASDWDLNGELTPIDASVTLGVFVRWIDPFCETPLGIWLGLCTSGAAMGSSASEAAPGKRGAAMESSGSEAAPSEARLRVGRVGARSGEEVTLAVTTREALEVGSSGLSLSYDAGVLEVVSVESGLGGFMYRVDKGEGVIRTASAGLGQSLAAGDALLSVVFRVKPDAERGRYSVSLEGDLGGPVLDGQIPEPITPVARPGFVRVRR